MPSCANVSKSENYRLQTETGIRTVKNVESELEE
jgi:hypothetical protein